MYAYTDFVVNRELCTDMTIFDVDEDYSTISTLYNTLNSCADALSAPEYFVTDETSLQDFANTLIEFI